MGPCWAVTELMRGSGNSGGEIKQSAEQRPGTVWAGFVPSATRQRVLRESPGSVPLQRTSRVPPLLGMPS